MKKIYSLSRRRQLYTFYWVSNYCLKWEWGSVYRFLKCMRGRESLWGVVFIVLGR